MLEINMCLFNILRLMVSSPHHWNINFSDVKYQMKVGLHIRAMLYRYTLGK